MATISSKQIIVEMLKHGGVYEGDPAPDSIWSYTGMNGERLFACFYCGQYCDIYNSPYVINPVLLFAEGEITDAGTELIEEAQSEHSESTLPRPPFVH